MHEKYKKKKKAPEINLITSMTPMKEQTANTVITSQLKKTKLYNKNLINT